LPEKKAAPKASEAAICYLLKITFFTILKISGIWGMRKIIETAIMMIPKA
jgi:hypothetical protein